MGNIKVNDRVSSLGHPATWQQSTSARRIVVSVGTAASLFKEVLNGLVKPPRAESAEDAKEIRRA